MLKVVSFKNNKVFFESTNHESVINWLITILFDGQVKRCKCKIIQYYEDQKEYCKIEGVYNDKNVIVSGVSNDWGNFINMTDTLRNNNIIIK